MDNQLPELKVNMLGRFSITYGEQPITFKRNSATKAVKLLQILLHSSLVEDRGSTGIPRAQLLDDLFGREELANVGNNLRVTVFRLRKILRRLCAYRKEQHEYDTILELTDNAIEIYPFDEWQSLKIDALMGMNRYKEAYQLYDATSKMFFEELGITPSERMMNQFQEMSERMGRKYHAAGEIKEDLKEPEYEDGAFYCSLPSFRDNYRLVRRLIERNGQSAFLMVCSLTDGNGHPMENREKLDVMSMELHRAVKNSLRRGDSFSKYSPSQFLILLVGTNQENCDIIFRRIAARFTQKHGSWNKYLEYYVSSIADVENPNARLSFQKNEFRWK